MKMHETPTEARNGAVGEIKLGGVDGFPSGSKIIAPAAYFKNCMVAAWVDLRMALLMAAWVLAYVAWAMLSTLCGNLHPWRYFWPTARLEWRFAMAVRRARRMFPPFADVGADARLRDAIEGYRKLREEERKWES